MLYIWEDIPMIEEAVKIEKENRILIETLKFLTVSITVNLIMVLVGEIIKKIVFL